MVEKFEDKTAHGVPDDVSFASNGSPADEPALMYQMTSKERIEHSWNECWSGCVPPTDVLCTSVISGGKKVRVFTPPVANVQDDILKQVNLKKVRDDTNMLEFEIEKFNQKMSNCPSVPNDLMDGNDHAEWKQRRMQSNESAAQTRTINLDNVTDANQLEPYYELHHLHKKFQAFYLMTSDDMKPSDDESEQIQSAAISASKPPGFHIDQSQMLQKFEQLRQKKSGQPFDEDANILYVLLKKGYGNYQIDQCQPVEDESEKVRTVYARVEELLCTFFPNDYHGQCLKEGLDKYKEQLVTDKNDTDLALSNVHQMINEILHYSFRDLKKEDKQETYSMTVDQYCLWIQDFFHISILHRSILQNAHHLEVGRNLHLHDRGQMMVLKHHLIGMVLVKHSSVDHPGRRMMVNTQSGRLASGRQQGPRVLRRHIIVKEQTQALVPSSS